MSNQKFLEKTADYLLKKVGHQAGDTLVVFPNKRPLLFLKNYLMEQTESNLWLPEMMSIDDFITSASGLQQEDTVAIYFKLYQLHKTIAGSNARSLDDFLNWAPVILHDFEDTDYALADARTLFSFLTDVRVLEQWNPNGQPLTAMQKAYLDFYRAQIDYYEQLRAGLLENKMGYRAQIYRYLAENIATLSEAFPWKHLFFIGFNALTPAEKTILNYLRNHFDFEFLVDGDAYYLDTPKQQQKEAGRFLNNLFAEWHMENPKWVANNLLSQSKHFEVAAVPLSVGQTRYAGQLVNTLLQEGNNPLEIAIVLGDENLLIPLLSSLPERNPATGHKIPYNVTLGYPLSQSPYQYLVEKWIEILLQRERDPEQKIFVPLVLELIHSSIMQFLSGNKGRYLEKKLIQSNQVMISKQALSSLISNSGLEFLEMMLLAEFQHFNQVLTALFKLLTAIAEKSNEEENPTNLLWKYQTDLLWQQLKYLEHVVSPNREEITLKTCQILFHEIFKTTKVNLRGEPLSGIQIMGLLETRSLDFKNLIVLGANEGIVPRNTFQDTLIPMDIRKRFGLTLPQDASAVYAHHFFRLLQRAEKAVFLFNSQQGDMGGGEKSRFLLQIKDELLPLNPAIHYTETFINSPLKKEVASETISIEKNEDVLLQLEKLAHAGISPSAFNTFITCPIKFYFRYLLKLQEEEALEPSVEANTFGSVVHGVLEDMLTPFLGKTVNVKEIEKSLQSVDTLLKKHFLIEYKIADLKYGRNLLIYNVAKEYVLRFVNNDIRALTKEARKILALEKKFESSFQTGEIKIKIKGVFDRIDALPDGADIRIIDYKTGKVEPKDLSFSSWEKLLESEKYSKAFQVLLYAWLYKKNVPQTTGIRPGIISMRNRSFGFMEVKLPDKETDILSVLPEFENILGNLVQLLFDVSTPFVQRKEDRVCGFCEFKRICNRTG